MNKEELIYEAKESIKVIRHAILLSNITLKFGISEAFKGTIQYTEDIINKLETLYDKNEKTYAETMLLDKSIRVLEKQDTPEEVISIHSRLLQEECGIYNLILRSINTDKLVKGDITHNGRLLYVMMVNNYRKIKN